MARADTMATTGGHLAALVGAAFHATPNGVVIQDPSGAILAANDAAARILGLTSDQLRGRTSHDPRWQAVHPDGRPIPGDEHPAMAALQSGEAVRGVVMGIQTPDGQQRWLRVDSVPLVTGGVLRGVASFFVDTTAQRGAEGALVRANDRLRMATEAGRLGLFEWDPSTGVLWCDDGAASIVGCEELSSSGPLQILLKAVHPADRDRAEWQMRVALADSAPSEGTYRVVRPDGSQRSIMLQAGVAASAEGSPRLTGAIVDVTELQAAHQRVVELLESMTDAYFTLDGHYRFTYVNPAAERLLGLDRDALLGRVIWDEFVDAAGSAFERHYRTTMTTGRPVEFESFYAPHGRWYEARAHVVPGGIAVYFRDVSERHRIDQERERLLRDERAARAAAEQARAELAHLAAHDVLTGLPNRSSLATWLSDRLPRLRPGRVLAVCYVDLDRFKLVNDSWGHSEGDRLLVDAARRIRGALRPGDFMARLGGDEFVVVVEGRRQRDLLDVTERFAARLRDPFDVGGREVVVTASVGVAFAGRDTDAESLVRDADTALYRAKEAGRDRIVVFDDAIRRAVLARIEIEADLRAALASAAIVPHYQPAFSLTTGQVVGVEALARWRHPVRGDVAIVAQVLQRGLRPVPLSRCGQDARGRLQEGDVVVAEVRPPAAVGGEDAEGPIPCADADAHAALDAGIGQHVMDAEARLGDHVGHDHGVRRGQGEPRLRPLVGRDDEAADDIGAPAGAGAHEQAAVIRQQLEHADQLDVEVLRDQPRGELEQLVEVVSLQRLPGELGDARLLPQAHLEGAFRLPALLQLGGGRLEQARVLDRDGGTLREAVEEAGIVLVERLGALVPADRHHADHAAAAAERRDHHAAERVGVVDHAVVRGQLPEELLHVGDDHRLPLADHAPHRLARVG